MTDPLIDYEVIAPDRRKRMRKLVNDNSVKVRCDRDSLKEMIEWCDENIGEERPYHPIHEADEGWMDYFEGEWALDRTEKNFWFFNARMLSAFMLRWSADYVMERPE